MAGCLNSYIENWPALVKICENEARRDKIDPIVKGKVTNMGLKRSAEELRDQLNPIANALDKMQSDTCTIAMAVDIWKSLGEEFESAPREVKRKYNARYDQAVTPAHLLAYLIDPHLCGKKLSQEEDDQAMEYAREKWPSLIPLIIKFKAQTPPCQSFKFDANVLKSVSSIEWWMANKSAVDEESMKGLKQLFSAVASSEGVERVFSSYGIVHSKLRNRLGTETAAMLVFLFKLLNKSI